MRNRVHRQPFLNHSARYEAERRARSHTVRNPIITAMYSSAEWRHLRAECLRLANYRCSVPGCNHRASIADHARPHRGNNSLFFDLANLRAMCKPCHDRKTARFDGGFGNARRRDRWRDGSSDRRATRVQSTAAQPGAGTGGRASGGGSAISGPVDAERASLVDISQTQMAKTALHEKQMRPAGAAAATRDGGPSAPARDPRRVPPGTLRDVPTFTRGEGGSRAGRSAVLTSSKRG